MLGLPWWSWKPEITCILASYNRPRMIQDALKSVADQDFKNFELIVADDGSNFDVEKVVKEFSFQSAEVLRCNVTREERRTTNRLAINMNLALKIARGKLICFLCDDDYYYPGWFRAASDFFKRNPTIRAAYGKLSYHHNTLWELPYTRAPLRFPGHIVADPRSILDHNQVVHRNFNPPYKWNESNDYQFADAPDAWYFYEISKDYSFHPIDAWGVVKRMHPKNLQSVLHAHRAGQVQEIRE